jgi:hypothetical protein
VRTGAFDFGGLVGAFGCHCSSLAVRPVGVVAAMPLVVRE